MHVLFDINNLKKIQKIIISIVLKSFTIFIVSESSNYVKYNLVN